VSVILDWEEEVPFVWIRIQPYCDRGLKGRKKKRRGNPAARGNPFERYEGKQGEEGGVSSGFPEFVTE
jgi:hypothetical protein